MLLAARGMTHQRHAELRQMLQARRDAIEGQVQQRIRACRDKNITAARVRLRAGTYGLP